MSNIKANKKVNSNKSLGWKFGDHQKLHQLLKKWILANKLPWTGKEKLMSLNPQIGDRVLVPIMGTPDTDAITITEVDKLPNNWTKLKGTEDVTQTEYVMWMSGYPYPVPQAYFKDGVWIPIYSKYDDLLVGGTTRVFTPNGGMLTLNYDPFEAWGYVAAIVPKLWNLIAQFHAAVFMRRIKECLYYSFYMSNDKYLNFTKQELKAFEALAEVAASHGELTYKKVKDHLVAIKFKNIKAQCGKHKYDLRKLLRRPDFPDVKGVTEALPIVYTPTPDENKDAGETK